jgi:hypothetical protein
MKCTPITPDIDVCVTVEVKLIYKRPHDGDIKTELIRNDALRKARYLGSKFEAEIAAHLAGAMPAEDFA